MSRSKIIKFIFLSIPVIVLIFVLSSRKASTTEQVVVGVVELLKTGSFDHYQDTLINYYDPEPSWSPGGQYGTATEPEVAGVSALLIELDTGKILFEKNSMEKRKIASLTKIMTAVVALEHKKLDSKILVSGKAANIGENAMGLSEGEVYTLEDLLYGLILNSGNDAAYAIAEGVAGDSGRFVEWMNFKAKDLGLKDTYFADPSGLDDTTYSTALDLVKLTRYTLKNPEFKKIVGTFEYEAIDDAHKYIYMQNQTNLLTTYPGVAGVKTGYTEEAGLTLVTYAENDGHKVVGAVLNSTDRKGDMILMLDHGFSTLGVLVEHHLLDY